MPDFKLAFIYRPSNPYLCGLRYNNNYSKFYFGALPRCEGVRVDYFGAEDVFDCRTIAGRYDAYLFYDTDEWGIPPKLQNIELLTAPKVCSIGDAHAAGKWSEAYQCSRMEAYRNFGFDACYYQHSPNYFYRFWPQDVTYWWMPLGVDPVLYRKVSKFHGRTPGRPLLTGTHGLPYYPLRTALKDSPLVHYVRPGSYSGWKSYAPGEHDGDGYKYLLEQWEAGIASAYTVVCKYFEVPAAGCLTFAYVDDDNGCDIIGFKDGETAVLVTLDNVEDKIEEYRRSSLDSRWPKIAAAGREFIMSTYTHDLCAARLIQKIKELAGG